MGNQASNQLSASQDHITDYKLDTVLYAGVCVASEFLDPTYLRRTIYARQFFFSFFFFFWWQATDSIPPQVSRKESFKPLYWIRADQTVA